MVEQDNIIVLQDENGKYVEFEFLDLIEFEGEEYVVLLPTHDEDVDTPEVVILLVVEGNDEDESFISVDDDETMSHVFDIFKTRFKDVFDFVD